MTADRLVANVVIALALLLGACAGTLRAKFPTEDEVRANLRKGMTAEQVLATFGEPPGVQWVDVRLGGKVHYIAPAATRSKPGLGYAGFTVYFDRGRVWDWEVILLNPSYEPRLLPEGARSWQVQVAVLAILTVGSFFGVRFALARRSDRRELLRAYAAREIPVAELPPDFRFLTHDTTLEAVRAEAGPPARTVRIAAKESGNATAITAFEYELPNDAALFVMPEPPAEAESRIRAVVYRRTR